jgi:hypothetical protein
MGNDVKQTDEDRAVVRSLFAEAAGILEGLNSRHDQIDCGLILCFGLALHKLDHLTDEAYLGLITNTLSKALVDMRELR